MKLQIKPRRTAGRRKSPKPWCLCLIPQPAAHWCTQKSLNPILPASRPTNIMRLQLKWRIGRFPYMTPAQTHTLRLFLLLYQICAILVGRKDHTPLKLYKYGINLIQQICIPYLWYMALFSAYFTAATGVEIWKYLQYKDKEAMEVSQARNIYLTELARFHRTSEHEECASQSGLTRYFWCLQSWLLPMTISTVCASQLWYSEWLRMEISMLIPNLGGIYD